MADRHGNISMRYRLSVSALELVYSFLLVDRYLSVCSRLDCYQSVLLLLNR